MIDRISFNKPKEGTDRDRSPSKVCENKSSSRNDGYSRGRLEVTEGLPLRIQGGGPKLSERSKLIQAAMEAMGVNYQDYLTGCRFKRQDRTEEQREAVKLYMSLRQRCARQEEMGELPTVESITTDFIDSRCHNNYVVYSHMSETEIEAKRSYDRKGKNKELNEATEDEKAAIRKYRQLLKLFNAEDLTYNEAGSSQQETGSYGSRGLLADLGNIHTEINESWDRSQKNWEKIKDILHIKSDSYNPTDSSEED